MSFAILRRAYRLAMGSNVLLGMPKIKTDRDDVVAVEAEASLVTADRHRHLLRHSLPGFEGDRPGVHIDLPPSEIGKTNRASRGTASNRSFPRKPNLRDAVTKKPPSLLCDRPGLALRALLWGRSPMGASQAGIVRKPISLYGVIISSADFASTSIQTGNVSDADLREATEKLNAARKKSAGETKTGTNG